MKAKAIKLVLLASAACLPVAVYSVFDPGFALFAAPILFVLTAAGATVGWFVLKLCRCPEWGRYVLILAGIACWSVHLGVTTHHTYTAEGRFVRLLGAPVPKSVRFIDSHGYVAMAGGYEVIVFSIARQDFDAMLKARDFKPYEIKPERADSLEQRVVSQARDHGIEPVHVYRTGEDYSFVLLLANDARSRVFLFRFKL